MPELCARVCVCACFYGLCITVNMVYMVYRVYRVYMAYKVEQVVRHLGGS